MVRLVGELRRRLGGLTHRMAPPPYALLDLLSGKWRAVALEAVAKLGVAEHLASGPRSITELARATESHEEALYRVMRALAREGLFDESPRRVFALTPLSRPLLAEAPDSMLQLILNSGTEREQRLWTCASLLYSIRTGQSAHEEIFDMDLWTRFRREPEEARIFHGAMVNLTRKVAPSIAAAYDFGRFATVVDLGGGAGELLAEILVQHGTVRGIDFDMKPALAEASMTFSKRGVAKRVEIVEGDMFEAIPTGHDAYLMKHIVHGFGDERLAPLMKNLREAMRPEGKLLLVEHVVPESGGYMQALDLQMLLGSYGGRERSEAQFRSLLDLYGFELEAILPTPGPLSLLVARRA
jgi:SAM-dependent methyltransferase